MAERYELSAGDFSVDIYGNDLIIRIPVEGGMKISVMLSVSEAEGLARRL